MSGSALVGQPPKTKEDYAVVLAFARIANIPEGMFDPSKGFPMPLVRPPSDHYPVSYPDRAPQIIAAMSVAIFLVLSITGTRLGLRVLRKDLQWGWDDIVVVPAALCVISWLSIVIAMTTHGGLGKHYYDVTYDEVYWFLRLAGIDQLIFYISVTLIKISIALFNRRLTGLTSSRWMIAHNIFLCLLVIYLVLGILLNVLVCSPAGVQYDAIRYGSLPEKPRCLNQNSMTISLSIVHIIFDFALLSVPLIVLSQIQMNIAKKLRIGFLFSVGSISCIGSVMRQVLSYNSPVDMTWYTKIISWTTVDIFFAITAASLPVLNALVPKRWRFSTPSLPRFVYWSESRRSGQNRASVRLGSEESIRRPPFRPYGGPEPRFHDESILNDTPNQSYTTTAPDGTVLLEVQRLSSFEQAMDVEKFGMSAVRGEESAASPQRPTAALPPDQHF